MTQRPAGGVSDADIDSVAEEEEDPNVIAALRARITEVQGQYRAILKSKLRGAVAQRGRR